MLERLAGDKHISLLDPDKKVLCFHRQITGKYTFVSQDKFEDYLKAAGKDSQHLRLF